MLSVHRGRRSVRTEVRIAMMHGMKKGPLRWRPARCTITPLRDAVIIAWTLFPHPCVRPARRCTVTPSQTCECKNVSMYLTFDNRSNRYTPRATPCTPTRSRPRPQPPRRQPPPRGRHSPRPRCLHLRHWCRCSRYSRSPRQPCPGCSGCALLPPARSGRTTSRTADPRLRRAMRGRAMAGRWRRCCTRCAGTASRSASCS